MRSILSWSLFLALLACGSEPKAPPPAPEAPAPSAPVVAAKPAPTVAATPVDADEACGQMLVVAYKGAAHAADTIKRDQAAARARTDELLKEIQGGADFAELAKKESDAPSSAPRGGVMGTYKKSDWPELHAALRDPLFALQVGETSSAIVQADYGLVLVHRCPVEKAHSRHILVRYKGAKRAGPEIKRDKAAAQKRAEELLKQLASGTDFATLAKSASEDSSAERGGDIGTVGRGLLALPYEQALFALKPGERTGVVETEFGFHIIERLP